MKNPGSPKNTQTQINFYSSLRRRASQNSKRSNDNDKFTTIPYVDRKTSPCFIKKVRLHINEGIHQKDKNAYKMLNLVSIRWR